jgi:hypothetical protein
MIRKIRTVVAYSVCVGQAAVETDQVGAVSGMEELWGNGNALYINLSGGYRHTHR